MADVKITGEAQGEFEGLPEVIQYRMRGIFEKLRNFPNVSGAKPLRKELSGQFRVRTGDYRVRFSYDKDADSVYILQVGHRDGFYE